MKKVFSFKNLFKFIFILNLLVSTFISTQTLAACGSTNYTWAGNNQNWNTASNWSPNGVPNTADENVTLTPINNLRIEQHTIGCFDVSSGRLRSSSGGPVLSITGDYFRALNANTIQFQNNHNVVIRMAGNGNQTFEAVDQITYLEVANNNLVRITQPGRIRKGINFTGTGSILQIEGQGQLQLDSALTIPAGITVKIMNGATL
ncbi:MAG: hypothetical protein NXH75_18305, partial [Halobacteriovoraceae bacterium]|nr:hypothetical protein [Halobacteriovoraceae bacterium]